MSSRSCRQRYACLPRGAMLMYLSTVPALSQCVRLDYRKSLGTRMNIKRQLAWLCCSFGCHNPRNCRRSAKRRRRASPEPGRSGAGFVRGTLRSLPRRREPGPCRLAACRRPAGRAQVLRLGAGRAGRCADYRLGRGDGFPGPQRRREDLDDRHDPGPVAPGCRPGRGLRHGAAAGGPQGPGLRRHANRGVFKDLTVAETAQYTASLFAVSRPVGEVLERAGITAIAGRAVGKCSGRTTAAALRDGADP